MKLPITDEFLWDIYSVINKTGDIFEFLAKPPTMANWLPGPKNPVFNKYRNDKNRRKFGDLIYYLKKNGYIKLKELQSNQAILITKKGANKLLKASFKLNTDGKVKRKDGKWIMLIFDVPQKHPKARELLRSILHNLKYKLFQQSVWVTPYDVSNETEKLLQLYSLEKYVKIFLVEEL